jgi:hypothetical protein
MKKDLLTGRSGIRRLNGNSTPQGATGGGSRWRAKQNALGR